MDTSESHPLLQRARQGDARALQELVAQQLPGLRAYVRLRCGPALRARESASDIVQSACRDVLERLDGFEWQGEAAFRAWLCKAALHKIADRAAHWEAGKRDARREVALEACHVPDGSGLQPLAEVYASVASPSAAAAGRESLARLEAAFDRLAEEEREVIVLARVLGLPHEELARHLGCSVGAARQRLFRALGALSLALEDVDG